MSPIGQRAWELYRLLRQADSAAIGKVAQTDLKGVIRYYLREEADKAGVSYIKLLNECDRINNGGSHE